jgi:hypothetical protein
MYKKEEEGEKKETRNRGIYMGNKCMNRERLTRMKPIFASTALNEEFYTVA